MKSEAHSPRCAPHLLPTTGNGGTVVGVHLTRGSIRIVLIRHGQIQAHRHILLPPQMALYTPEFEVLLGHALRELCGHTGRISLWATAPLDGLSVHSIRIPRVPRRQLLLAVRWALRKALAGSLKDSLIDYVVEGETVEDGTRKIAVTACAVHQSAVDRLQTLFTTMGFPLTGLTPPSFTFKNLVGACRADSPAQDALFLNVDCDSSQILVFHRGKVVVDREFRLGAKAFVDACMNEAQTDDSTKTFFAALSDEPSGAAPLTGPARNQVVEGFSPVLHRLMRKVDLTLESSAISIEALDLTAVHLAGPLCVCREIRELVSVHVGLPVVALNPLSAVGLREPCTDPASLVDASWFTTAVGLALSDGAHTLNFLNPTQSTLEKDDRKTLNQRILVGFIIAALTAAAAWGGLSMRVAQLQRDADRLDKQLAQAPTVLQMEALKLKVNMLVNRREQRAEVVRSRMVLALMHELTMLADAEIQLTDVHFQMPLLSRMAGGASHPTAAGEAYTICLKGRISGDRTVQASMLAGFQIKLDESPLFGDVHIDESVSAIHSDAAVLQFSITITPSEGKHGRPS